MFRISDEAFWEGHPEGSHLMDLRRTRSRGEVFLSFVAAAMSWFVLVCWVFLVRPSIRARDLLWELERLRLEHATFEDAQRLAKRIGAKPTGTSCDRSFCDWDVRVSNSELPRWWRGAGEVFVVYFDVKDSKVVRKGTGYGIGVETDTFFPSSVELEEQKHWERRNAKEPVTAGWKTTHLPRYNQFAIYLTPQASAEDLRLYTAFDFSCFWKYEGCKDAKELLPIAGSHANEVIE